MSYVTFDATVPGADEGVGVRAKIGAGEQTVLTTDAVTSRVGSNIVTAAETFVDAIKNAG